MLIVLVDVQALEHEGFETIVREHTANGADNDFFLFVFHHFLQRRAVQTSGVTGMVDVRLATELAWLEREFCGVDDDDMISTELMWREARTMLAPEHHGHACSHTAKRLPFGIHEMPERCRCGNNGRFHCDFFEEDLGRRNWNLGFFVFESFPMSDLS